jgi:hypothetical protein
MAGNNGWVRNVAGTNPTARALAGAAQTSCTHKSDTHQKCDPAAWGSLGRKRAAARAPGLPASQAGGARGKE